MKASVPKVCRLVFPHERPKRVADGVWARTRIQSFADAYVDDDAIYERLIDERLKR